MICWADDGKLLASALARCGKQRWPDVRVHPSTVLAQQRVPTLARRFSNSGPTFLTAAAQCCLAAVAAYNFNSFFYFTVPIEALI